MHMRNKKTFTAPRVLQTLDVILEEDFLQGPSQIMEEMSVHSMGTERKTEDFSTASDNLWYD